MAKLKKSLAVTWYRKLWQHNSIAILTKSSILDGEFLNQPGLSCYLGDVKSSHVELP
jgi:hypothetical protein